ncbi:MAG: rhomboid family intramembrane serine protease, partial [Litorivicinaceae bacterium]
PDRLYTRADGSDFDDLNIYAVSAQTFLNRLRLPFSMQIVPVFGGPPTPKTLWWLTGLMLMLEGLAQLSDRGWFGVLDLRGLMISYGAFWDFLFPPGAVHQALFPGQSYSMLLTHAFLHAGTIHVLMNAVIFIALGKTLAVYFGLRLVMVTMLLGALSSGVAFGLLESTAAPMVGASGVVFAFIGLWLQASRSELKRLGRPGRSTASVMMSLIVIHVLLHVFMGGQIAWQAHLGGFVAGYFLMPWLIDRSHSPTY